MGRLCLVDYRRTTTFDPVLEDGEREGKEGGEELRENIFGFKCCRL